MANGKIWSDSEKDVLKSHYSHLSSKELSAAFPGRSPRSLNDMARRLGVGKSRERMAEIGRTNSLERWRREKAS